MSATGVNPATQQGRLSPLEFGHTYTTPIANPFPMSNPSHLKISGLHRPLLPTRMNFPYILRGVICSLRHTPHLCIGFYCTPLVLKISPAKKNVIRFECSLVLNESRHPTTQCRPQKSWNAWFPLSPSFLATPPDCRPRRSSPFAPLPTPLTPRWQWTLPSPSPHQIFACKAYYLPLDFYPKSRVKCRPIHINTQQRET